MSIPITWISLLVAANSLRKGEINVLGQRGGLKENESSEHPHMGRNQELSSALCLFHYRAEGLASPHVIGTL